MPEPRKPFQRRTWVRRAIPIGVVAVLVGAGTAVVRTNASATPLDTYRTTSVTTGSVEQRLNLTGSVQRVNQVTESFATDGIVSSVLVSVGDTVKAGQPLATLDPSPLRSAVTDAQASLAQAKATLESDQSAAAAATATAAAATAAAAAPSPTPRASSPSGRSGPGTGSAQSLARTQKLATSTQRAVTTDLERTSAALTLCAPFFPSGTPAPATTDTTPTTGPTPPSTTATPSADEIAACLGALNTAPTQQQIQRDQQALNSAQANLAKAVTSAITAAGTTAQSSGSTSRSATSQPATSQSATNQSTSARTGATSQSSADRVVSDQAAVTSADAALTSAASDLAASTLKASIAGTVGSVSLVKNASSNGNNVVIVGPGAVEVTVNVPLVSMPNVHVGQKANVRPQGATSVVPGAVTSISLLPSTSPSTSTSSTASASTSPAGSASRTATGTGQATATTSSPTYPVVVLVPDALPALASGARAEVSLLIGTATNVLTVPNSALTPLGNGQALAMTFKNGVATRAVVKTGYAGTLTTQVASGLTAGQQVVLADLSTALPTNTTNARRFGVGGAAGGLGGTGFGGATGGFGGATGGFGGGTGSGRGSFTPGG
ncbi:MAG TPA: biotin/lipoyl-binding protein [Dermatophilaceae bacterium]